MVGLMGAFLALVTLGFVVLGFFGYQSIRQVHVETKEIRRVRNQAENVLAEAKSTVANAQHASSQIEQMRDGMKGAFRKIDSVFDGLPEIESRILVGEPAPELPPETVIVFEDCDSILLVSDALGLFSGTDANPARAQAFLKVATYWRVVRQFARAQARLERAAALAPADARVRRHLGKNLLFWETVEGHEPEIRSRRLARAVKELALAHALEENWLVLHDLAFAYDELGDFDKAVNHYTEARNLHRTGLAQAEAEDWDITYNLACSLAKAERFEETLLELEPLLGLNDNWKAVEKDQDFKKLRDTPPWSERLEAMLNRFRPG